MYRQAELLEALTELENGRHTFQNCEKMAAIYTILDHMEGPRMQGYSGDAVEAEIGLYGNSEFLRTVSGKPPRDVWLLIDELVEALAVLNPKLLNNFLDKLNSI